MADVIHRISITVEDELNGETTPGYQTTEAPTEYQPPKKETTTVNEELQTIPPLTEESVAEEISSPISEINEEITLDNAPENEVKLLNTEFGGNTFEDEVKDAIPEEVVPASTSDNIPEIFSESTSKTDYPSSEEDIHTSPPSTEQNLQTDNPDVAEIPVANEEVAKEIKRFRSLYNNDTDNLTTDDETKHTVTEKAPLHQDSPVQPVNVAVEEVKETTVPEVQPEQNDSEKSTTKTLVLSKIAEDKIAEYLISLKKPSTQFPSNEEASTDSIVSVTFTDNKPSETTIEVKEVTVELIEQTTPNSATSNDAQEGLVKVFNDLADAREGAVILEETSTSQKNSNDLVTEKNTESTTVEASTPGQTTQFKTVETSTKDLPENYTINDNVTTITALDKQDDNSETSTENN